nr:hypothetical protein [Orientia tsutsugamushi]
MTRKINTKYVLKPLKEKECTEVNISLLTKNVPNMQNKNVIIANKIEHRSSVLLDRVYKDE